MGSGISSPSSPSQAENRGAQAILTQQGANLVDEILLRPGPETLTDLNVAKREIVFFRESIAHLARGIREAEAEELDLSLSDYVRRQRETRAMSVEEETQRKHSPDALKKRVSLAEDRLRESYDNRKKMLRKANRKRRLTLHSDAISLVIPMLSPADICECCCVSRSFRSSCSNQEVWKIASKQIFTGMHSSEDFSCSQLTTAWRVQAAEEWKQLELRHIVCGQLGMACRSDGWSWNMEVASVMVFEVVGNVLSSDDALCLWRSKGGNFSINQKLSMGKLRREPSSSDGRLMEIKVRTGTLKVDASERSPLAPFQSSREDSGESSFEFFALYQIIGGQALGSHLAHEARALTGNLERPPASRLAFASLLLSCCSWMNNCNGHGEFDPQTKSCSCYDGYGSSADISEFKDPACATRVCPSGAAWWDLPSSTTTSHGLKECSNAGTCDRTSGECQCFHGFSGPACDRLGCPNNCGGHGRCVSIASMAVLKDAEIVGGATRYTGETESTDAWDKEKAYGCICDSEWKVGLGAGEYQQGQWYGPDCSKLRCPSGDDPMTEADETDCSGKSENGASTSGTTGAEGNKCVVECSNRGLCDSTIGRCLCFTGFRGAACEVQDALSISSA
eukprot:g3496.t1